MHFCQWLMMQVQIEKALFGCIYLFFDHLYGSRPQQMSPVPLLLLCFLSFTSLSVAVSPSYSVLMGQPSGTNTRQGHSPPSTPPAGSAKGPGHQRQEERSANQHP